MATEVTVPRLGWSMDEGVFGQWLKKDGDTVREGEALFVLESEKATQEIESFESGILRIPPDGPQAGEPVRVGQILAYICQPNEERAPFDTSDTGKASAQHAARNRPLPVLGEGGTLPRESVNGQPAPAHEEQVASPSVRRLARELGVDLNALTVDAPAQRITLEHVHSLAAMQNGPQPTPGFSGPKPVRVSPRAARAAAKLGVSLSDVASRGTSGRICERDVLDLFARHQVEITEHEPPHVGPGGPPRPLSFPAGTPSEPINVPVSTIRRTIASRMLAAAQETACVTLASSADATTLVKLRRECRSAESAAWVPTFTDLFVKLVAAALKQQPALLCQWTDNGIVAPEGIHIAVAVDTAAGLVAPVLCDVPQKSLHEISEALAALAARARTGSLAASELAGGTFTLTNLGRYRVQSFTPLLNLPQSAILGIGQVTSQPVVRDGSVVVRETVPLSLTFDHRVADGAAAAALLTSICETVENPLPYLFG